MGNPSGIESRAEDVPLVSVDEALRIINSYCETTLEGCLECRDTPDKGKVLHATKPVKVGDVILREDLMHLVQEDENNPLFRKLKKLCDDEQLDYDPLWFWCALCSFTNSDLPVGDGPHVELPTIGKVNQQRLLLLYKPQVCTPSESSLRVLEVLEIRVNQHLFEVLLQIWIHNCFEHSESPLGYSTYFMSSFYSHSCRPNAVWHYEGERYVLRARMPIDKGDEVTITYIAEEALMASAVTRKTSLVNTKGFVCTCERCIADHDKSRGMLCAKCTSATVFFPTYMREDSTNKRLSSRLKPTSIPKSQRIVCENCGTLPVDVVQTMWNDEKMLVDYIENLEQQKEEGNQYLQDLVTPEVVEKLKQFLARISGRGGASNHYAAAAACNLLAEWYQHKGDLPSLKESLANQERRLSFYKRTYPELNGAVAWALEDMGDLQVKIRDQMVAEGSEKQARKSRDDEDIYNTYAQSRVILSQMFGADHEYTERVDDKIAQIKRR